MYLDSSILTRSPCQEVRMEGRGAPEVRNVGGDNLGGQSLEVV